MKPVKLTNDITINEKMGISGISGILGAAASNFFEVQKVRLIAELGRPEKYVRKLNSHNWNTGLNFALARAFLYNSVLIYPYDYMKEASYNTFGDVFINKIVAVMYASLVGTLLVLPADNMKTRVQT